MLLKVMTIRPDKEQTNLSSVPESAGMSPSMSHGL